MATSGSTDYNRTAQQLIRGAFRLLGITQAGEVPSHDEQINALETLELMVKSWQAQGLHLWTYSEATLFITPGTESYSLPGARAVSSFIQTETADDELSGATSIELDDATGISDTDVIGVRVSASSIHWTTVSGAPSGNTVTLAAGLPDDVSAGAAVYSYATTETIDRPLRIEQVRRRNSSQDTPIIELGREDYFALPNKSSQSTPTQWYYDPQRGTGQLYIWPTGATVDDTLKVTYQRGIEDFDAAANDPDFPSEWLETLKYNLAVRLAPEYGIQLRPDVAGMAVSLLEELKGWDREPTSVYMQPNFRGWG